MTRTFAKSGGKVHDMALFPAFPADSFIFPAPSFLLILADASNMAGQSLLPRLSENQMKELENLDKDVETVAFLSL
jgi:hypothetical protein